MERAGKKTRDIQFFSKKNGAMVCLHSPAARDYAKFLEEQPWVGNYEAGVPLSEELYCHVSPVGIRNLYFKTPWVSDFLLHYADGRRGIRALVRADNLQKRVLQSAWSFPEDIGHLRILMSGKLSWCQGNEISGGEVSHEKIQSKAEKHQYEGGTLNGHQKISRRGPHERNRTAIDGSGFQIQLQMQKMRQVL